MSLVWWGVIASTLAGGMTAIGALPVLLGKTVSPRLKDMLLAFAAGVMLAASFFSLIIPGLERGAELFGGKLAAAAIASTGIAIGVAFVAVLDVIVPHQHFAQGRQGPLDAEIAKIWLFTLAITIHNIPEGLAVGVGYGGGDIAAGTTLAIGIGLQNAPEGLAVALALWSIGYSKTFAVLIAGLTGAVEPVAGAIGAYAVSISQVVLPWALTFAAGAMLYVISHEIIPETHKGGHEKAATFGLTVGLIAMMVLDVVFG